MANKVTNSLSTSTAGDGILVARGWVSLSGTWTGTATIQVDPDGDGTWEDATDASGTALSFTGNLSCPIANEVPVKTRINFSRSTGTLVATIVGDPRTP